MNKPLYSFGDIVIILQRCNEIEEINFMNNIQDVLMEGHSESMKGLIYMAIKTKTKVIVNNQSDI